MDINTESIAAIRTESVVAFFQNNATRNMTKIPGVNKPVKFWIYWNISSEFPRIGFATIKAINIDITTADLPMWIRFDCDISFFEKDLHTSIVKIVLMLLVIDAKDETIAEINAAKVNKSNTLGYNSIIIVGYAWSVFSRTGNNTAAQIPGKTITNGIKSFK